MEIIRTEVINFNNILLNIYYYPIKTISYFVDYTNNIVGIYSPDFCGRTILKNLLYNAIDLSKILEKNNFKFTLYPRSYLVNNSDFYILGKKYNLKIIDCHENDLEIDEINNRIIIYIKNKKFRSLIDNLAIKKLSHVVEKYLNIYTEKMGLKNINYIIKRMISDGSYNKSDNIVNISTKMFNYPLQCIEVLIVHELSHFFVIGMDRNFIKLWINFYPLGEHHNGAIMIIII